jgi:protein-tyrosine phosphatase
MSSDPITPPQVEESTPGGTPPPTAAAEAPQLHFSFIHWATMGVLRLLYRRWTRIAVAVFPENSRAANLALRVHLPLPDTLNMSWVTDRLAVGGRIRPEDVKTLSKVGITSVVDTRSEFCDDKEALAQEQIELLYLPTPDTYPLTVEQLMEGAKWANEKISRGGRVLIHCEHGIGRSVLLTCATLIYGGMNASDALHLVQKKRWQAAPNHRQVERLKDFEKAFQTRESKA